MTSFISRVGAGVISVREIAVRTLAPVGPEARLAGLVLFVGAMVYTVLFAEIAPIHDATHHLRHTVLSLPCH